MSSVALIAEQNDRDGPMQDRALEIVHQFCCDRRLILYGGLAIDYSLKLKGSFLYPPGKRPDYDMFSSRNVDDAYELADILHKKGFPQVLAERGIHVQTMRVKINFIFVADISYTPPNVFDSMPTLEYMGLRVLHPDYQRLDQHLAFCFPFNGAPREDIFNRWDKDLARFNMFQEFYPMAGKSSDDLMKFAPNKTLVTQIDTKKNIIAIHGIAAFGLLQSALRELKKATTVLVEIKSHNKVHDAPLITTTITDSDITIVLPSSHADLYKYISIATPETDQVLSSIESGKNNVIRYKPFMDAKPKTIVIERDNSVPLHIFSVDGRQLAIIQNHGISIVSPQYLLLHFLHEYHQAQSDKLKELMLQYYIWTLDILAEGSSYLVNLAKLKDSHEFAILVNSSPFSLTTRTIGAINQDYAYIIKMAGIIAAVGDTPPASLQLPPNITQILIGLPKRYVPATNNNKPKFDYTSNILFQRTGKKEDTDI